MPENLQPIFEKNPWIEKLYKSGKAEFIPYSDIRKDSYIHFGRNDYSFNKCENNAFKYLARLPKDRNAHICGGYILESDGTTTQHYWVYDEGMGHVDPTPLFDENGIIYYIGFHIPHINNKNVWDYYDNENYTWTWWKDNHMKAGGIWDEFVSKLVKESKKRKKSLILSEKVLSSLYPMGYTFE